MRIAYLMNGLIGNLTSKNMVNADSESRPLIINYTSSSHKYLRNKDIKIDYFIFTWEEDLIEEYQKNYNPVSLIHEYPKSFQVPDYLKNKGHDDRVQAHYSRWYGAMKIMNECNNYANKNNIQYDLIVNARLDLCFHHQINLNLLDKNKFHVPFAVNNAGYGWPRNNELSDHIFVANQRNMTNFLNMYNHLNEYTSPGQCPQYATISSHFLCVWHLKKLGLLDKNIITESFKTTIFEPGFKHGVDYHIFRYEKLNKEQLQAKIINN
jgi:hypothetical protein